MPSSYLALFKAPGAKGFSSAGLLARMPISMMGIGLITMLSQTQGGYALAGGVAATFTLSSALLAPQVSRAVDRFGQGKVLPLAGGVSALSLLALLLCSWLNLTNWALFLFAALGGLIPSMSAMVRARWTVLYRGQPQLKTAYALESVLDEVCFIVGAPLSVGLSVTLFPEAGPLFAVLCLIFGVGAFALQSATEPPLLPNDTNKMRSAIYEPSVRLLSLLLLAMGVIVGVVDVMSVALAKAQGSPAAASIVLSVYAMASCVAGLAFGSRNIRLPLSRLLLYSGIATALSTIPMVLSWNILSLTLAVLLAGLSFAPTMIIAMSLVETTIPDNNLTEGLTWLITGLGIGVALGAALTGWVIDNYGTSKGFLIALVAGVGVCVAVIQGHRVIEKQLA